MTPPDACCSTQIAKSFAFIDRFKSDDYKRMEKGTFGKSQRSKRRVDLHQCGLAAALTGWAA